MDEIKTDRRSRMTREMIKNALVELLQQQHISRISVKQLCEKADINRSTFYAHYSSPQGALDAITSEVLANLNNYIAGFDGDSNVPINARILSEILEYARQNAGVFKVLVSENCSFEIKAAILNISAIMDGPVYSKLGLRQKEYVIEFFINGCVSLLKKWLNDDMPESPQEMAQLILALLNSGMSAIT